ncbi:cytochrome P450 [Aspergillus alliaceus]|uniref:Cytochrome P450 n=1 Tax=Petromyces alliaceus TaxID=209559 RepID=A0A5N7BVG5_PETAA|nr:cytochrome P450 [Aspergillus alliaceus]
MFLLILYAFLTAVVARKLSAAISVYRYRKVHGLLLARPLNQKGDVIGFSLFRGMQKSAREGLSLQRHYENTQQHGPTISAVLLGKSFISTSDPENIKAVLATQFQDFNLGERNDAFAPFLGRGIFTEDGPEWERSRALIRPSLSKAQVAELPIIEQHVQNLLSRIPGDGSTVDLQQLFFNFTLDSATHSLLGQPVGFQLSPAGSEAERFSRAFDDAQAFLQVRAKLGPFRGLVRNKAFEVNCQLVHSAVDRYVSEALGRSARPRSEDGKPGSMRYDLLSELASTMTDGTQIRNELLNVLLAARDTTASLLSSVFFMLARHPRVWSRLQQEVVQLEGQRPTYDKLREMRYVRAVLNEALRLFPPVPTNIRCATCHTSLPRGGGVDGLQPVFVANGTIVHYSIWTMHRSTAIYGSDAEEYRPERWLQESDEAPLRPGWGFLPFSGGPRICLGQQKALTEAAYVVIRMLQTFATVQSRDQRPWREHMGLVLSSFHGVQVALRHVEG